MRHLLVGGWNLAHIDGSEMASDQSPSFDDFLADPNGDISKLRKLGITDYAIITFIVRVREGQSRERALRGLLVGRRFLTEEQKQLVRTILNSLPILQSGADR